MKGTIIAIAFLISGCTEHGVAKKSGCTAVGPHGPGGAFTACVTYHDPRPGFSLHADPSVWKKVGDFIIPDERMLVHFIDRTEKAQIEVLVGSERYDPMKATVVHREDVIRLGLPARPIVPMAALRGREGYQYRYPSHANAVESMFLVAHFRFAEAPDLQFFIRANWPEKDAGLETEAIRVIESIRLLDAPSTAPY